MPKMKTHSGAKKRFKVTGTGKIMRGQAGKSHLLTGKSKSRKLRLTRQVEVNPTDVMRVKRMLLMA